MVRKVVLQTRPENADHWDPGISSYYTGFKSRDEAIRYTLAEAKRCAEEMQKRNDKQKRLDNYK